MGRKKRKPSKPWCWYCNRDFEDEKVLTFHQKAKHFKCHVCHKKLYTAPGLAIHCSQVHKEIVTKVPNAIAGRDNIELEIYGMEGIPPEDRIAHEKERGGKSDTYEEPAKKMKMDAGPPAQMMFPGMVPGFPAVMPGMAPVMPGMVPPAVGVAPPTAIVPQGVTPPRPLFPAAQVPNSVPPPRMPVPAPVVEAPAKEVPKVVPLPENCKLMHPEEDLSMEQIRSKLPKYQVPKQDRPPVSAPQPFNALGIMGPPILRPGMPPPPSSVPVPMPANVIRPGMGPPMMDGRPHFQPPPVGQIPPPM